MEEPDYDNLSDEALEKALVDTAMEQAEVIPGKPIDRQVEPEPEPEAVAEPEEVPEPIEAEAAPEEAPAEEAEPPAEEEPQDVDAELSELYNTESDARAKHFESVAGRLGGELGYIKRQMEQMRATRQVEKPQADGELYEETSQRPPEPPRQDDKFSAWAITRAAEDAKNRFVAEHPDYAEKIAELGQYVEARGLDPKEILLSDDPGDVERRVTHLLDEHYWHVRAETTRVRRAELLTKRAEQTEKAVAAKKRAGVSASGSAPPPKPKPKTQEEMSDAEIEAELQRLTGGRW